MVNSISQLSNGYFGGRSLVQQKGSKGGARNVFVKFDDIKDDLVFPTFGGQVMNPFPGAAKIYAGDLMEFRTKEDGLQGEVYLLKTFKVFNSSTGNQLNIERDGYKHIPFPGDKIGIAPNEIGGEMTTATVVKVVKNTMGGVPVWQLTLDKAFTASEGDILVEADANNKMLVKNINAVAAWDYDFMYSEAADPTADDEFEAARYFLTPALRGTMYMSKMSVLPECVKNLNICNINGWFRVDALNKK